MTRNEFSRLRALRGGEGEGWRVRKDGSRFWANVVIDQIRDENGKLIGFTKITRDIRSAGEFANDQAYKFPPGEKVTLDEVERIRI